MPNTPNTTNDILPGRKEYMPYMPSDETLTVLVRCVRDECDRLNALEGNNNYLFSEQDIEKLQRIFVENFMGSVQIYPGIEGISDDLTIYENGKFNDVFEHLLTGMTLGIQDMEGRYEVLKSVGNDLLKRTKEIPIGTDRVKIKVENGNIILVKTPSSNGVAAMKILSKLKNKVTFG